jgi:dTDP-4-amino-4,6-dideoxygalactose transaminase
MNIRFLDLSVQDPQMKKELLQAVDNVLTHGQIMLGPEVQELENNIAEMANKKYALGVNSGTDALFIALRGIGVGKGDEVITTPLSWIASFNAIAMCGATPICVDICDKLTIDTNLIEEAITRKTKAILPVHFGSQICDMDHIMRIADKHQLYVIEDAAQAFGSYLNKKMAGSFGYVNCYSMNPMKVFNAYGEAGAIVTDHKELYENMSMLRYAGTFNKEECLMPSLNGKIDTLQAAMMLVSLKYIHKKIEKRSWIANIYRQSLKDLVVCPEEDEQVKLAYYNYTIIAEDRDNLKQYLTDKGIETKIQHPILMPNQKAYQHLTNKYKIPNAERLVNRILCLPINEKLIPDQQEYVINSIKDFYAG